jgi:hypothetical protein
MSDESLGGAVSPPHLLFCEGHRKTKVPLSTSILLRLVLRSNYPGRCSAPHIPLRNGQKTLPDLKVPVGSADQVQTLLPQTDIPSPLEEHFPSLDTPFVMSRFQKKSLRFQTYYIPLLTTDHMLMGFSSM